MSSYLECVGQYVLVQKDRLQELEASDSMLDALYGAGVENWEGYTEALKVFSGITLPIPGEEPLT